jgi:uncharacterized protein (TIGR00369 family)
LEIVNLNRCFGCGKDNPVGLHLEITYVNDKAHIEFIVEPDYCGYPGIMHGGAIATLFDEAMFHAIARLGIKAVTTSMTIDFKSPAFAGHRLVAEARVKNRGGNGGKIEVEAVITDSGTGKIIAEGKGKFVEIDYKKLLGNR